jgi:uncharacterized zinc-type alcohol dehydrogenase-like protein
MGRTTYPCVPGHEIVGCVVKVGREVKKFKEGDLAAVGCLVNSDRVCESCKAGLEQFCAGPATFTYNSPDPHTGGMTYGGYSKTIVVDQDFVLRLSDKLELAASAPLLCAGITTYSPLRNGRWAAAKKLASSDWVALHIWRSSLPTPSARMSRYSPLHREKLPMRSVSARMKS